MPSAAAKSEKIASYEQADSVKQIVNMIEKRIRNLEKRKMKLDGYRLDVKNGKELNEDQKIAVSKYDQVESLLEFSQELLKSMNSVVVDSARQQKKLAKKEQLERQQHEIQRLQESFMYSHILSSFQNEDVRNDFLKGENGAVQLTSEQLSQLDQLHKLIESGLPTEQADLSNHFHTLAENHIFLVEGKNKEIIGTTYKVLKDLLVSIKESGYFSRPSGSVEADEVSSDDTPEDEMSVKNEPKDSVTSGDCDLVQQQCNEQDYEEISVVSPPSEEITCPEMAPVNNGPLQDVLSSESAFNFLQESQIDLGDPHLDPAVVAVHQMAPPPPPGPVSYTNSSFAAPQSVEEKPVNGSESCDIATQPPPVNHLPAMPSAVPRTSTTAMSAVQLSSQQEFDPSHPIPTQTFTNQSFAVMQNMIMPQAYVPVTMHHGPMPPHAIAPIAVMPGLTPATTGASVVPMAVPMAAASIPPAVMSLDEMEPKSDEAEDEKPCEENGPNGDNESSTNHNSHEKNGENGYAPNYRGGYRRGRGRGSNGYYRGRSNYNGRGGFQNHYYQDRNGYNGNYRRGNNRGPRGGGNGNNRGRGNYRTQPGQSTQQQHQPQQQQAQ